MKATPTRTYCKPLQVALLIASFGLATSANTAPTSIADEPLANPSPSAHPNIMFILDDSGSMEWEYSPDYVSDNDLVWNDGTLRSESDPAICFDHKDDDNAISVTPANGAVGTSGARLKTCRLGDPPFMSPDFNKQYYNPEILYNPGINYDGTSMTNMNAANTSNWTAVPTDGFGIQQRTQLQNQIYNNSNSTVTVDLTTQYPDRIWCTSQAAQWGDLDDAMGTVTGTPNAPLCVKNSGYSYPNNLYGYGKNTDTLAKLVYGAPYYYRIPIAEYCDTQDRTNCQNTESSSFNFSSTMRWCSNSGTSSYIGTDPYDITQYSNSFASCQGKRLDSYTYPKELGRVVSVAGTAPIPPSQATASFSVGSNSSSTLSLNAIIIEGVNLISPNTSYSSNGVTKSSGSTLIQATTGTDNSSERLATATIIARSVNDIQASTGYQASCPGIAYGATAGTCTTASVTLRANTAGAAFNGKTASFSTIATGSYVSATGNVQIEAVANPSSITNLTVNGMPIIASTVNCNLSNTTTNRRTCQLNLCNAINAYTATSGYSARTSGRTSCTTDSNTLTIIAPSGTGASANGWQIVEEGSVNTTADNTTKPTLSGGVSPTANLIPLSPSPATFAGGGEGSAGLPGLPPTRVGVSAFSRTNIVPGLTYPKYPKRADCNTDGCTYEQEMTNFANWYAYYRTRMQMMKSAAGRTFASIDDGYRVGFKTINFSTTKYLKVSDFTSGPSGHKKAWYDKFYARAPSGGTPLREALSRAGWIFAGKYGTGLTSGLTTADDPMQISCQQNYSILSSDGYWNGNGGQDLDGNSMTNEDNNDAGWSLRTDGAYDGQQPNTSCTSGSAPRSCGTLADVAMYYYKTDLRTDTGWDNDVPKGYEGGRVKDTATHQHMTTFTIGLGLDGYLSYRPDYNSSTVNTGDFYAITQGTKNWPAVAADAPSALDDLWHAAINGKGQFFSAGNPEELVSGLTDALNTIKSVTGAGAAAATSNLQPVAGDNFAFTAEYTTADWTGDLKARTIDLSSGVVSDIVLWSAKDKLDNKDWTTRQLFTFDAGDPLPAGNQLRHFCWSGASGVCSDGSLTSAELTAYFNPATLTHYAALFPSQQLAVTKEKLVDYLRGDTSNEDSGSTTTFDDDLFRSRVSILGDIISAQPIYVKSALFEYKDSSVSSIDQDEGYAKFRQCTEGTGSLTALDCPTSVFPHYPAPRRGTVFAAANDGMLHAFETDVNNNPYYQTGGIGTTATGDDTFTGNNDGNGEERWAYIPGVLLPNLKVLAQKPYQHKFLLDGSPTVGDICISQTTTSTVDGPVTHCSGTGSWRTILVGGLNKGGRGYYALDITNPEAPKALWEFASSSTCLTDSEANSGTYASDCHLGLSYGNPIITKRKSDGKWVVYVTSGYNNVTPGSGKGYLYMLDAYTGKILKRISTDVGCDGVSTTTPCVAGTVDPSGLAKINGWVTNGAIDNTTLAIYGGDLKGNLWKFDLDPDNTSSYLTAVKLATLTDPDGTAQPVTTKPELAYISGYRAVYLGTGKLLGTDDLVDDQVQTVYAIRDDMNNATVDGRVDTVLQSLDTLGGNTRSTTTNNLVNWDTHKGWRVDLPEERERANVDPVLQLGTLTIPSNIPGTDACQAGGSSFINFFDIKTGKGVEIESGNLASVKFGNAMIVGINVIKLPGGQIKVIVTTSDNKQITADNPVPSASFTGKRVSWRELIKEQ